MGQKKKKKKKKKKKNDVDGKLVMDTRVRPTDSHFIFSSFRVAILAAVRFLNFSPPPAKTPLGS
jgi:hypothetical protein